MNTLLVTETYFPWITGVSVSTDNIATFLASRGHSVTIICPHQRIKGHIPHTKGVRVVQVPSLPFSFYNSAASAIFPITLLILNKLLKETKFDVVHVQEPGILGVSALFIAKRHNIPVVGALHFIPEQIDRVLWGSVEPIFTPLLTKYIRFIYNKYDHVFTVSNYFKGVLKKAGVKKPIDIISNGVDVSEYAPGVKNKTVREHYSFSSRDIVFFYIGRLDRDKNVETLVRAMPYCNQNVKLLIVGRGTEIVFLRFLAKKLGVGSRVKWDSFVTDSEMNNLYKSLDVFTIMSPYEGQSIVTLQAIASGLPVIAANASALPEIVKDNENGFLVGSYDVRTLALKMNKLAKSKTLRARFGAKSRKMSLIHDRKIVLQKLTKIYIMLNNVER